MFTQRFAVSRDRSARRSMRPLSSRPRDRDARIENAVRQYRADDFGDCDVAREHCARRSDDWNVAREHRAHVCEAWNAVRQPRARRSSARTRSGSLARAVPALERGPAASRAPFQR